MILAALDHHTILQVFVVHDDRSIAVLREISDLLGSPIRWDVEFPAQVNIAYRHDVRPSIRANRRQPTDILGKNEGQFTVGQNGSHRDQLALNKILLLP